MKRLVPSAARVGTLTALLLGAGSASVLVATAEAAFPGKNGKLFYTEERPSKGRIMAVNANGTRARPVPARQRFDGSQASVSPDGRRIVFQSYRNGNSELYLMRANGSNVRRLTRTRRVEEVLPSWSPNGSRIAFQAGRRNSGEQDVYTIKVNGTSRKRLTNAPGSDSDPAWSPNGKWIAFTSNRPGSDGFDLHIMSSTGRGERALTRIPNDEGEPSWAPDSSRIAMSVGAFNPATGMIRDDIYTVAADGSQLKAITTHPAFDYTPAWSPDGKRIAFVSDRGGNFDVFSVSAADGSGEVRLTRSRFNETHIDWARR